MSAQPTVRVMHLVGTRPNLVKVAPVMAALAEWNRSADAARLRFAQTLVHTGQHYDRSLSEMFFRDLGLPQPDENLGVGSGSQAQQTARLLESIEPVVLRDHPDIVLVPGDVNSTCAGALVAAKLGVRVVHLEAGLRSGDRSMPEEINRIVTDHLSDLLLTTCEDADRNLRAEGIPPSRTVRVGNTMIDSLMRLRHQADEAARTAGQRLGLGDDPFLLVTLHRPSNVDSPEQLDRLLCVLEDLASDMAVVFPVHPRTTARLRDALPTGPRWAPSGRVIFCDPLGYLEFLGLMGRAAAVMTDSGGVQEETTVLGTPCITVRTSTERPVTITGGTNRLVDPYDAQAVAAAVRTAVSQGRPATPPRIPLWDGAAGRRVAAALADWASAHLT